MASGAKFSKSSELLRAMTVSHSPVYLQYSAQHWIWTQAQWIFECMNLFCCPNAPLTVLLTQNKKAKVFSRAPMSQRRLALMSFLAHPLLSPLLTLLSLLSPQGLCTSCFFCPVIWMAYHLHFFQGSTQMSFFPVILHPLKPALFFSQACVTF